MKSLAIVSILLIVVLGAFGTACSSGSNSNPTTSAYYRAPATTQSLPTTTIVPATTLPPTTTQPPATTTAMVILTLAVAGTGTVSPAVGAHSYSQGTVLSISATPASGWQFAGWTGTVADSKASTTTVTVNANQSVTATFTQVTTPPATTLPPSAGCDCPPCDGG